MAEEQYIPINKGHFELDTNERIEEFQQKMRQGWEEQYREYRRLWSEAPQNKEIRDYPLLVDLELSSVCNLKCPMCYTITEEFRGKVKKGLMDFELVKKIVDEIAGKVYSLRLSLRGEPTLHKNFIEAIAYAKKKGIGEISFLTNGSTLELDNFIKMAEAGADWITVSVDGVNEEYENIRRPLKFAETLAKLTAIHEYKKKNGLTKPVIKVQGIWPAIRPNPGRYYNTLAPVTDLLAYNPLIDYLRKDKEIEYEDNFSCPQLYQRLVVGSDGNVLMCANDEDGEGILGNAYQQSIHEIWHGKELNRIRDIHRQDGGFLSLDICRLCYYPRKAIPNEKAMVNDREIWIENYTNRRQVVGE